MLGFPEVIRRAIEVAWQGQCPEFQTDGTFDGSVFVAEQMGRYFGCQTICEIRPGNRVVVMPDDWKPGD